MTRNEFEDLFLFTEMSAIIKFENKKELSLQEYIDTINSEQLILFDEESDQIIITNRLQAYLECKVVKNPMYRWCSLLLCIVPMLGASLLYGLSTVDAETLNGFVIFGYIYNLFDVGVKIYAFGGWRYFYYSQYDDPPYVQWCSYEKQKCKMKSVPMSLNYLNHDDWKWCKQYLSNNFIDPNITSWERRYESMVNWFDFILIIISILGIILSLIFMDGGNEMIYNDIGYLRMWLLLPLLRMFVLLKNNKIITFELIKVLSNGNTFNIFIFAVLYIFIWARIGMTLFYGKSDIVLEDIYNTDANTGFDSLTKSILLLVQIMIGDSWGDIMYVNVLATSISSVYYFVIFVLIITLFIVNIVIGLILAGVDAIEEQIKQQRKRK